ncbi:hypothetical protein [uncultured Nocardioides sp.]|uniref:hypothetical protein n=1 Tax=uncultured Nocardioides sp. TaxID=198441 RepID=UPI00260880BE|nr:hypothetical protein [uncultured Nocardioides sp.]
MSRRPWAAARLAAPLALVLSLVACSSDEDAPAPEADRSSSSTASEDTDPGVVTEDDGSSVTTYQGIPPGFPLDEVPLLDEDNIVSGSTSEEKGRTSYSVIVGSDQQALDARAAAVDQLAGTDLQLLGEVPTAEDEPVVYTGDGGLFVVLLVAGFDDGSELTYSVETK